MDSDPFTTCDYCDMSQLTTKKYSKMKTVKIITLVLLLVPLVAGIYPEYCLQKVDCDSDQICKENQCICDAAQDFRYDELLDLCVKLSGGKCGSDDAYNDDDDVYDCVENAKCDLVTKTCTCKNGYTVTSSRECKRSFGEPCDDIDLCNYSGFLVCDKNSSLCDCTDTEKMTYDPTLQSCVSKLGEECEFYEWMGFKKNCIQNAHCVRLLTANPQDYSGICQCQIEFSNKSSTFCGKLYGESCQSHADCFTGFCQDGDQSSCACSDKSIFDPDLHTCRVKVGHHCVKDQLCVENAYCHLKSRQCLCSSSKFSTVDGHCTVRTTMVPQQLAHWDNSPADEGNRILQSMPILVVILLLLFGICNHYLLY